MCGTGVEVIDSTVGTVCTSVHLRGLVGVGVGDGTLLNVQTLGRGIGLDVGKESDENLGGLLRPGNLVASYLQLLGLCVTADGASVLGEGDGLLVLEDVLKVCLCLQDSATLDSLADLTAVLVVNTDVISTGLGHYKRRGEERGSSGCYVTKVEVKRKGEMKVRQCFQEEVCVDSITSGIFSVYKQEFANIYRLMKTLVHSSMQRNTRICNRAFTTSRRANASSPRLEVARGQF